MRAKKLKQIIPAKACSTCDVCCRFMDKASMFTPHLTALDREGLFKAGLAAAAINKNRFNLSSHESLYCCPCFAASENRCSFYSHRPFECELYPFLLATKNNKVYLALDKKCPYAKEGFIEQNGGHIAYLKEFLQSPEISGLIKKSEDFLADYSTDGDVLYIEELSLDL